MTTDAEHAGGETKSNWRALLAAWLGWAFDGLDGYLYIMVAIPFVRRLVANEHGVQPADVLASPDLSGEVMSKAAIIQAVFLVGWACGGAVFGRIGDRLGRSRTLTLTILTYAIFTGLAFFSHVWWHLLIFRFLAALGIGGEWAAGSALVSETLNPKHRAWASAALQSGYILGCIGAVLTNKWIVGAGIDPKWVFVIGVLPAFVTLWIRKNVPEPEEWKNAAEGQPPPRVRDLFARGIARTTTVLMVYISLALTAAWAFLYFVPQMMGRAPEAKGWSDAEAARQKSWLALSYFVVNILANFAATYLALWIGYRRAFAVMSLGGVLTALLMFRTQPTQGELYLASCVFAFFGLGLFAMFPLYVPPLFPTLLRTLGAGVTYNVGRLVAAGGTLLGGVITQQVGGPSQAFWWVGVLCAPMVVVAFFLPEGKRAGRASARL